MAKTNLPRWALVGRAVGAALLAVLAYICFRSTLAVADSGNWVAHTYEVIGVLETVQARAVDAETGQRGYLLTGDVAYQEPYERARAEVGAALDHLGSLTADNPEQQASLVDLRGLVSRRLAVVAEAIAVRDRDGLDAAVRSVQTGLGKRVMDDIRRLIGVMQERERALLARRAAAAGEASRQGHLRFGLLMAVTVSLIAVSWAVETRYVSMRRQVEARLQQAALYDTLTRLPNRALLAARVTQCAARVRRRPGMTFAVMYIDLDGFKQVNDRLGHDAGDALLVRVARALEASVRETDMVARLGGDEFVVLLEDVPEPPAAVITADRIMANLVMTTDGPDGPLHTSASAGVVMGDGGVTVEDLLRAADAAMYRAKQSGKARWVMAGARAEARGGLAKEPVAV
jgi:diguanylate cyclase (GGDEF)-like protein